MAPHRKRSSGTEPAATRRQLLAAASTVFAEYGFRDSTVREICRRAGANVAAISYHFGDKSALYSAVLNETAPAPAGGPNATSTPRIQNLPAEQRLAHFIREFLTRIAENGPDCHHSRIMAREMIEPTEALDQLVNGFIRPQHEWFQGLVREMLGARFSGEEIHRVANSVISQVLFYRHCGAVIERLQGRNPLDQPDLDGLAAHITEFSLAAIRSLARSRRRPSSLKSPNRKNPVRRL
jgi:AcrR family transcriptional regulator